MLFNNALQHYAAPLKPPLKGLPPPALLPLTSMYLSALVQFLSLFSMYLMQNHSPGWRGQRQGGAGRRVWSQESRGSGREGGRLPLVRNRQPAARSPCRPPHLALHLVPIDGLRQVKGLALAVARAPRPQPVGKLLRTLARPAWGGCKARYGTAACLPDCSRLSESYGPTPGPGQAPASAGPGLPPCSAGTPAQPLGPHPGACPPARPPTLRQVRNPTWALSKEMQTNLLAGPCRS